MNSFPFFRQLDQMDCGPSCLRMIAKYYGKSFSLDFLREKCFITREGVSLLGLSDAAESINLRSLNVSINFDTLKNNVSLPCIAHWRQRHFVVVYKVTNKYIYVADPAFGHIKYNKEKFIEGWLYNKKEFEDGMILLLEPTPEFDQIDGDTIKKSSYRSFLLHYLKPHRHYIYQLTFGLIASTIIQLIFPFTTQAIVDYGINTQNLSFIYIVLAGQLMLFLSQTIVSVLRSWILLHVGARVNITIISDFLSKLMKLPQAFFDSKMTADVMQRIDDNRRVETFLSSTSLNAIFSAFTLLVFGCVLAYYNVKIFLIFIFATLLYVLWVLIFVHRRAELDYKRYDAAAENRSSILQLVTGISEIKLNNSEKRRRWEWEAIQTRLFKISVQGLTYTQYQFTGSNFINEFKNIVIIIIAANDVITGKLSLGVMLAIQYILGQLNAPITDFITFIQSAQDAKLSIERLTEVYNKEDEAVGQAPDVDLIESSIRLINVSLTYGGPKSKQILKNVSFEIPHGKVTAIVGASGSGKTSLLKLLLKIYPPTSGEIYYGKENIKDINTVQLRSNCGAVMQDGFIFADTIARNITESENHDKIDKEKLKQAVQIANLEDLIEALPTGYNTNLSWGGISLSGGERQRVLIARAIYKNPQFLFFDEATSALDANNERSIMEKLSGFYVGKTVLVVAHRLSTVKNADQIIVIDKGQIVETGTHAELVAKSGFYYTLVKNQLELGN